MLQLLLIEDEHLIRTELVKFLQRNEFEVREAESVEQAMQDYMLDDFDIVLTDIRLPGIDGTHLLKYSKDVPVVVMTSYASVDSAVNAMKQGAADYIAKPFDHYVLLELLNKIAKTRIAEKKPDAKPISPEILRIDGMVGKCPEIQEVCARIEKVAPTQATVLVLGESGTGKELVARAIHQRSGRAQSPFIVFNCAAVPDHLVEAELFGQGNSQGLLQRVAGGTLFLDEVGELPQMAQARLLRVLQAEEKTDAGDVLDVRVIAATHRDIRQQVQEQTFRSDLYFRLRVVELLLPPLRDRGEDIRELAIFLFDKHCARLGKTSLRMSKEALEAIRRYQWPGNVRELSNAIERAVILCDGDVITPDILAIDHYLGSSGQASSSMEGELSLEEYFRCFVLEHQQNMTEIQLAKKLGISRKSLWQRRQKFGIPRPGR
jgi:DNA-binding NtrC family response regulator